MAEYFDQEEERAGVRWSWHYFPNRKAGAPAGSGESFIPSDMVVPLGCLITPLRYNPGMPEEKRTPIRCKSCGAVANSFCRIEYASRAPFWTCNFCRTQNALNPQQQFAPDHPPPEFQQGVSTIEYIIPQHQATGAGATIPGPPVFLFTLDVAQNPDELESVKDALLQSLTRLPEDCLVGLITFGRHVSVWELGFGDCVKAVVFNGERSGKDKTYNLETVRDYLGIRPPQGAGRAVEAAFSLLGRILVPLSEAEAALGAVLEELSVDPWPTQQSQRNPRCTGAALEIATAVTELANAESQAQGKKHHGRILMFLTGPCCKGPGKVVSQGEEETLRSHKDIADGQAPHMEGATNFGKGLGKRLLHEGFCLDMFVCALDQVGLAEIAACTVYTGGRITMSDSFKGVKHDGTRASTPVFKRSFAKFFDSAQTLKNAPEVGNMFFSAITEVQTCSNTKICGCIGPVVGRGKTSPSVHPSLEVGDGGTCAWGTSVMDQGTTLAFVFDAAEDAAGAQPPAERFRYFQFITSYTNTRGEFRVRVTTTSQSIAPDPSPQSINAVLAFDQLAAAALCSRIAAKYMERAANKLSPVLRWVDRLLIRFVKKFAEYRPNDPNSLFLAQQYSMFPNFLYHLRRSEFMQVFNSSPDETVWYRHLLHRENVSNALVMVQPSLQCYEYGSAESSPVVLDSQSVKVDNILLCDSYFDIVVHHGRTIAEWRNKGFHEQQEYEAFAGQLKAPHEEVERIVASRFPCPKVTVCDQHGSQARYLYNKLNPSDTMKDHVQRDDVQIIHTEDANLQTFMAHLKRLAVQVEERK